MLKIFLFTLILFTSFLGENVFQQNFKNWRFLSALSELPVWFSKGVQLNKREHLQDWHIDDKCRSKLFFVIRLELPLKYNAYS